ncbi:hypothetical protein OIV83_004493 [Microbotryomycetes sp. JL201]|nr:hypothetical protein OIV83_004493 [Microbotryomycetes sp. JL201]
MSLTSPTTVSEFESTQACFSASTAADSVAAGDEAVAPGGDNIDDSFSFARTPSLASESYTTASEHGQRVGAGPRPAQTSRTTNDADAFDMSALVLQGHMKRRDVFPSKPASARRPPALQRTDSSTSDASSLTSSAAGSATATAPSSAHSRSSSYAPPPGLASTSASSLSKPSKPRGARVDYAPPLPPAAHWLLLTTPPPPPGNSARSEVRNYGDLSDAFATKVVLDHDRARERRKPQPTKTQTASVSKRKALAAALGFKGLNSVVPPPIDWSNRNVDQYAAPSRSVMRNQKPGSVQLQLGPSGSRSRSSLSSSASGTSSLRSSHASSRKTAILGGAIRLDSQSQAYEVPKTWNEYALMYSKGAIDIEDPPFPPISHNSDALSRPSPYQEGNFNAPPSSLEPLRRKLLLRFSLVAAAAAGTDFAGPASAAMAQAPSAASSSRATMSSNGHESLFHHRDMSVKRDSYASTAPSSAYSSNSPSMPFPTKNGRPASVSAAPRGITNHPTLVNILERARRLFGARMTLVSVLDDQRQLLLAAEGVPEQIESLPKAASICAHTLLNGEKGLVVLDTQRDWRFRNNVMAVVLGARFYAGMPVYGPSDPDLEEEAGGRIAIGTVAIIDDEPRSAFSPAERAKLRSLATDASNAISAWASARRSSVSSMSSFNSPIAPTSSTFSRPGHRSSHSTSSYIDWQTNTNAVARPTSSIEASAPGVPIERRGSISSAEGPTRTTRQVQHVRNASDTSSVYPGSDSTKPTFPSQTVRESPLTSRQKVFDLATKTLGQGLDLSLVYLVALDLGDDGGSDVNQIRLTLSSAWNLPPTTPSFDASLHLKALRAPEGGLLFKNPLMSPNMSRSLSKNVEIKAEQKSTTGTEQNAYASGILLPVTETNKVGYVLAGYTKDVEREFDEKELNAFLSVAEQLQKYLVR